MTTPTKTRSPRTPKPSRADAGPVAETRGKRSVNPKKASAAPKTGTAKTGSSKTTAAAAGKPAPKAGAKASSKKNTVLEVDELEVELVDDTEHTTPSKVLTETVEEASDDASDTDDELDEVVDAVPEPIDYNDRNTTLFTERNRVKSELEKLLAMSERRRPANYARRLQRAYRDMDEITTQIVKFNYGLVRSYTKKFTSNSSRDDSADFEASAVVGLMRAIDSFDPTKGRFGAWAYKPIQREVLRAVRDADFKSMNPGDFERRPDILRAVTKLQAGDDTRMPTNAAIAAEAGVTVDQVRRVLEAPHLESIHQRVGDDGATELGDLIESDTTGVEGSVLSALTLTALEDYGFSALDERELFVLIRRFGLDCEPEQKLASIGDMLGLSREAVRQVEAKALAKIMHPVIIRKIIRYGRP
jgi:RNA polymerase sigma factor (sigma-70 family)